MMGKCMYLRKGETHTAPINGILANTLAVGSIIKLMENNAAVEYMIVHQGLPGNLYDASCDGCWLLRKDIYTKCQWDSNNMNKLDSSTIQAYVTNTFQALFDANTNSIIKQIKIPYRTRGMSGSDQSGANGLLCKIFLLSGYEVGWTTSTSGNFPIDGACLSYFDGTETIDAKRIANFNGLADDWYLRSPATNSDIDVLRVRDDGDYAAYDASVSFGVRPALILPSNALFDKSTLLLKGVA